MTVYDSQGRLRGSGILALSVAALACLWTAPAAAQAERELDALLGRAQEAYDNLDLERSQEILAEAIDLADREDVDAPVVAQIHLMAGLVEHALSGDEQRVLEHFQDALRVDRDAELDPYYTTPDLEELLAEASASLPPEEEPAPPNALRHSPAVTVRTGQAVDVVAAVDPGAAVTRVVLAFRAFGQVRYVNEDLEPRAGGQFYGTIPAQATEEGIQLEYYIEAIGPAGAVVGSSGSSSSPHVVIILEGEDGLGRPVFSAALGIGTGGGLATGEPIVMGSEVDLNPGMALTPLHFFVDTGFRLGGPFELGPFLRLQTVLLQDGVELETLIGGRFKWFFADDNPRMYASAGAGWGHVRHTVDLKPTVDFVDTTREGPFHGGLGFGVAYLFSDHVGFLLDLYSMVLFDQVSVQLDLNLGLYLAF